MLVQNRENAECTVMCAVVFDIDKLLQLQTDYENIKNVPRIFMFYKVQFLYKSCNSTCINLCYQQHLYSDQTDSSLAYYSDNQTLKKNSNVK